MGDEHGSDFVDELMEFLLRNYYSMMIKRVKRFFQTSSMRKISLPKP